MTVETCPPDNHHFEHGGEGRDDWEAWLFCRKCGAIMMVPSDAGEAATILAPKPKGT